MSGTTATGPSETGPSAASGRAALGTVADAARSRLALELRVLAGDMAGQVDRDELALTEEMALAEAIEAAVEAVLPRIVDELEDILTPRLEALPLHARLTLARARGRQELCPG